MDWSQILTDMAHGASRGALLASVIPIPGISQAVGAVVGAGVVAAGYGFNAYQTAASTPPMPAARDMSATIVPASK